MLSEKGLPVRVNSGQKSLMSPSHTSSGRAIDCGLPIFMVTEQALMLLGYDVCVCACVCTEFIFATPMSPTEFTVGTPLLILSSVLHVGIVDGFLVLVHMLNKQSLVMLTYNKLWILIFPKCHTCVLVGLWTCTSSNHVTPCCTGTTAPLCGQ